ncbi:hypothetical protein [Thalassococcus sp. S3]|uniref:hypothetical protein n=1 Tax=Thalassococcus sp. S3 TaxID=2017482 RepID=UPI0010240B22|nr:hypothetical protein [Thalassococcus sp. S3]QBF31988.1 hypothetical protein CFI11_24410 [Thalassococcus sp. S3]
MKMRLLAALFASLIGLAAQARDHAPMAIGLSTVADWSTQAPFLDHMKSARPWIGHVAGQWGGSDHAALAAGGHLDSDGWPLRIPRELGSIGTLILTDLPSEATAFEGRYLLRFEGNGIVEVTGRAANVRYGRNRVAFDFTPGDGPVEIRIQRTDRARQNDHVRNITVVREDQVDAFDQGAVFNPEWLSRLEPFGAMRFMDWMDTNNSQQETWADRPKPQDYTWARTGVPAEILVELANEADVDAWFNMPHRADDAYIRAFAALVRDALEPGRTAYVEYSNEVWNWQFEQTRWADAQANALWQAKDAGMQFYGMRAAQVAQIWSDVFGAEADTRLVNVISSQTGWPGLEELAFTAPLWVDQPKAPVAYFDAYAITGYFGGILGTDERAPMVRGWIEDSRQAAAARATAEGLEGADRQAFLDRHAFDQAFGLAGAELMNGEVTGNVSDTVSDLIATTWPYHAKVAAAQDLDLIMYEGGTHVVGLGALVDDPALTPFFTAFNYSAEMGALYQRLLDGWDEIGGQMFTAYVDVYAPTKWGSWGGLRHLEDRNPRWDALVGAE